MQRDVGEDRESGAPVVQASGNVLDVDAKVVGRHSIGGRRLDDPVGGVPRHGEDAIAGAKTLDAGSNVEDLPDAGVTGPRRQSARRLTLRLRAPPEPVDLRASAHVGYQGLDQDLARTRPRDLELLDLRPSLDEGDPCPSHHFLT